MFPTVSTFAALSHGLSSARPGPAWMSSEEVALEFVLPDWQKARALSESGVLARTGGLFSVHVSRPVAHGPWITVCGTPDRTEKAKVSPELRNCCNGVYSIVAEALSVARCLIRRR